MEQNDETDQKDFKENKLKLDDIIKKYQTNELEVLKSNKIEKISAIDK